MSGNDAARQVPARWDARPLWDAPDRGVREHPGTGVPAGSAAGPAAGTLPDRT